MSENLDLVRSMYAAWESGDWTSAGWATVAIEFSVADGPAPGDWKGLTGLSDGWRSILDAWDDFRVEADEVRELDHERILVLSHYSGRGRTSGVEIGQTRAKGAGVFYLRSARVIKAIFYFDRDRALADLGLSE